MLAPLTPPPDTPPLRRRALKAVLSLLAGWQLDGALSSAQAQALPADASEEKIKAAYVLRPLNYVEWPASAFAATDSPYVIGVLEDEMVADEIMRAAAGRAVNQRQVQVRRLVAGAPGSDVHVLFISRSERPRQALLIRQLSGLPILVITETEGGLQQGGVLNFRIADSRVRFEISLAAAERAGLKLSARLLPLALAVVKGER
jgi:hypothetical protein